MTFPYQTIKPPPPALPITYTTAVYTQSNRVTAATNFTTVTFDLYRYCKIRSKTKSCLCNFRVENRESADYIDVINRLPNF